MNFESCLSVDTTIDSYNNPKIKYHIIKKIGHGGFGNVFKVRKLKDQKIFAMKVVSTTGKHRKRPKKTIFQSEATKLMQLKGHKHIMELEDTIYYPKISEAGMIMEFATEGDLENVFCRIPKKQHEALSKLVAYEMTEALHYIHSQKPAIVHRDIKPDNILAFLAGTARKPCYLFKLADFGIASTVDEDSEEDLALLPHQPMSGRAFPHFRAPETYPYDTGVHTRHFEVQADVYSLGVILAQIHNNTVITKGNPSLPITPEHANSLVKAMLEKDPKKRVSAQECKRYIWVREGAGVVILKPAGASGENSELDKSLKRLSIEY